MRRAAARLGAAILSAALTGCAHAPPVVVAAPADLACRGMTSAALLPVWLTPGRSRDRDALDRWCATVGPPLWRISSRPHTVPVERLVVVSWNTHVGGGDLSGFIGRLERGEFTGGRRVREFVLLLQEVYRHTADLPELADGARLPRAIVEHPPGGHRQSIDTVASALDLSLFYAPSMRNGREPEDRGNAILSTLPLERPTAIELPFERQRRVALAATVVLANGAAAPQRLRLATAHFDTSVSLWRGGPIAARRRQAQVLVDAVADADGTAIVGGDFNTWFGREPALDILRRSLPDAERTENVTWRGGLVLQASLDHIFARLPGEQTVRVTGLPNRFGSDHYPLLAFVPVTEP